MFHIFLWWKKPSGQGNIAPEGNSRYSSLQTEKRDGILKKKFIYTAFILVLFTVGKSIPLCGIDVDMYLHRTAAAEDLLLQTLSGDLYRCSLFALGISPYITASVLVQIMHSIQSTDLRTRHSPKKITRDTLLLTLLFSLLQSVSRVRDLSFRVGDGRELAMVQCIAVMEMTAGAFFILWLSERNKKYGIGGQTVLIFINILDGIRAVVCSSPVQKLTVSILISLVVMEIVLIMENTEMRIPLLRISVHNLYADKNYLAIKLNPIGVMPVMFSTAMFMLPQLLVRALRWTFPQNRSLLWLQENLLLSKPMGIMVYIVILYGLTIAFSMIFMNPKEMTESFLKSGDSIEGIHAGRATGRYLSRVIVGISVFSATVMGVCLGIPLVLQMSGGMDRTVFALPSSVMMLTGLFCNLQREVAALRDLASYRSFGLN